ncbi:serine dehydratase beta chain, partial [Halomonas daqiaonensis]
SLLQRVARVEVQLYGSLSATGIGHGTDRAVIMGLMGERPNHIDPDIIGPSIDTLREAEALHLDGHHRVPFLWARDMQLFEESLPHHPNAMRLIAYTDDGELYRNTYYSVGGGFVVNEAQAAGSELDSDTTSLPYDFQTAADLLRMCRESGLRISELMLENEKVRRSEADIRAGLTEVMGGSVAQVENAAEIGLDGWSFWA